MEPLYSYRALGIENPQTGPKTASTLFQAGEWLEYSSGLLLPLAPATGVVGLNLTPVPSTDATTNLITFDGINSTEDRFTMPLANKITYTVVTGVFQVGDIVTGGTSGAKGKVVKYTATTHIWVVAYSGVFSVGETITGSVSTATGTVGAVTAIASSNIGQSADIAGDSISLDVDNIGSGTQFTITKVISSTRVEVAVTKLLL